VETAWWGQGEAAGVKNIERMKREATFGRVLAAAAILWVFALPWVAALGNH
jgi:hypothetical protein